MSIAGNIHRNLAHRLFDGEISTDELLFEVSTEPRQLALPNLSAPDSVMAREKACSAQALPGMTLRNNQGGGALEY